MAIAHWLTGTEHRTRKQGNLLYKNKFQMEQRCKCKTKTKTKLLEKPKVKLKFLEEYVGIYSL